MAELICRGGVTRRRSACVHRGGRTSCARGVGGVGWGATGVGQRGCGAAGVVVRRRRWTTASGRPAASDLDNKFHFYFLAFHAQVIHILSRKPAHQKALADARARRGVFISVFRIFRCIERKPALATAPGEPTFLGSSSRSNSLCDAALLLRVPAAAATPCQFRCRATRPSRRRRGSAPPSSSRLPQPAPRRRSAR